MHVQNERKKKNKTETEGVKTPRRNNTDGENQSNKRWNGPFCFLQLQGLSQRLLGDAN